MCLEQFHYYLTEVDGKEAIWFRDMDRDKMIVQPFSFTFKDKEDDGTDWYGEIPFTLKLGDSKISSWLSECSTSLELIRHSMEHFLFSDTNIKLCYDDSPTQIMLKHLDVLERTTTNEYGTFFYWKHDLIRVIVKPDDFHRDDSILFGICKGQQVLKEFYEAFLRVGWWGYKYVGEYGKDVWDCPPMEFYNKIKSPLIEDYICDKKSDDSKARVRQVTVNHILTIWPDIFETISDEGRVACSYIEENDDFIIWVDDVEYKLHVPGIYQWQKDFERNADFVESKMKEDFDIDSWHKQGLELAAKIREQLPSNIDLWYKAPFEDSKNRDKHPLFIYNK